MEVKRIKTDLGHIKYEVSGCSHVRISAPPICGYNTGFWTIGIPDLRSPSLYGGFAIIVIYRSRTLSGVKEVLSRFSTEEELLEAYYKSRLAGKTQLF